MQIWAESGKSALPICNYSQILYQFLTFTQNLKRSQIYNRKLQFSELNFQLNNHSTNRCYMEANKPCNSGFSLPFFPLADRCSHFL